MTSAPPPATVPSPAPASPSPSPSPPLEQLPYVEGRLRFIKDSDFWFTDGNIVLMAMDFHLGASSKAFCVHRGLLSRHSDVFGLSFEAGLPDPTTADILGTVADCPIVRISDSYHDFKCFLRAVYDGYVTGDVLSFAEAAALVRTGHKYCAPLVQNVGLEILAPRNFEDLWNLVLHFREEAIEATNLFATVAPGSPAHLIAFYRCSQLEIRTILTGTRRADGFLETLSMEEIVRCLKVRELCAAARWAFETVPLQPRPFCEEPVACDGHLGRTAPGFGDALYGGVGSAVPDWERDRALCAPCRTYLAERELMFERQLMRRLPKMMQLEVEGWDSLCAADSGCSESM